MATQQVSEHLLITQLFDNQPDSVVWALPEFDEADLSLPVDFKVGYCNAAACVLLKTSKHAFMGSSLKSSSVLDEASQKLIFDQCLKIWQTNESLEFNYYSTALNKHFNVQRSKILNGVLNITRDHTAMVKDMEEKEHQSRLLNQIVETSESGISLYEAIRNKEGEILDFKLKLANKKCIDITGFSLEELYKYTLKELMVLRGQSSFFKIVCDVVETGNPFEMEFYSAPREKWIVLSIKKFGDGYLLHYVDITKTKNLEKQAQDQAELLTVILNASITGLLTLQAIYDSSGKIEDFKFIILNEVSRKLFGIEPKDDKTYLTLFPNAKKNGFFDLYVNVLTSGEPVSKEIFYKGEGYNGWYYISISKMNSNTLVQSFADVTHTRDSKP